MGEKSIDDNTKRMASLVQTRKTIRDKFSKLHNEKKVKRRELEEKYSPITSTLQKLIDVKKKTRSKPIKNENDYQNDVDMLSIGDEPTNIDDDDEPTDIGDQPIKYEMNRVRIKRPRVSDIDEMSAKENRKRNSPISIKTEQEINANAGAADNLNQQHVNKRNRESDEYTGLNPREKIKRFFNTILRRDAVEQSKNNIDHDEDDSISAVTEQSKSARKKLEKMVNDLNKLHDVRETGLKKYKTKNKHRNLHDESLIVVSPQDYDERGKFRGPGIKRSKHAVPEEKFKKTVQKFARKSSDEVPKRRNAKKAEKIINDIKMEKHSAIPVMTWKHVQNRVTSKGKIKKIKTDLIRDDLRRRLVSSNARHGDGLEEEFIPYTDNITYEYYDDPNELCERLMLLVSSKNAGNSNHGQEINSIIDELRERNVIV